MSLTAVILAGGRGTRMGGLEKGLLDWQGRPMIAHLIEQLAPHVDGILLNVNRAHARYATFGLPLIGDAPEFEGMGPLAGLHSALTNSPSECVICVPCDLPSLPPNLVQRLLAANTTQPPLVYASHQDRAFPTLCLAHSAWRDTLAASLRQGHCAAWRWLTEQGASVAQLEDAVLQNFNTPNDLREILAND